MIPILLESPILRAAGFRHGFSTRVVDFRGGAVARESVALALRFEAQRLFEVEQVHGDRVLDVSALEPGASVTGVRGERADALVATRAGDACGVRVADCVPVLLADSKTGVVAAVHAGWRGVALGIVEKAAERARPTHAAIGPCIGACCFEVGEDVAEKIAAVSDARVIARAEGGKAWVDLRRAVRAQLERARVGLVDDVEGCTRCDAERFFSHRREGEGAGRQIGVIVAR